MIECEMVGGPHDGERLCVATYMRTIDYPAMRGHARYLLPEPGELIKPSPEPLRYRDRGRRLGRVVLMEFEGH